MARKHTPIVSEKQRRFFGAQLGKKGGMSDEMIEMHLKESKGKKLPARSRGRGAKKEEGRCDGRGRGKCKM